MSQNPTLTGFERLSSEAPSKEARPIGSPDQQSISNDLLVKENEQLKALIKMLTEQISLLEGIDQVKDQIIAKFTTNESQLEEENTDSSDEEDEDKEDEKPMHCNSCEIVYCRGTRCRIHHSDGRSIHCGSCYSSEHANTPVQKSSFNSSYVQEVQCNGMRCRIHKNNGTGIHCLSCYGPCD